MVVGRGKREGSYDGPDVVGVGFVGGVPAVVVDLEEDGSVWGLRYQHVEVYCQEMDDRTYSSPGSHLSHPSSGHRAM